MQSNRLVAVTMLACLSPLAGCVLGDPSTSPGEIEPANVESGDIDSPPGMTADALNLPGWTLNWNDEFDTNGTPDPTKWGYETGKPRAIANGEVQTYTTDPSNVRVEDGALVIEVRGTNLNDITSASVITQNKKAFHYGRLEIRAKAPRWGGVWTAFFTLGTNKPTVGWPQCGEIDILEYVPKHNNDPKEPKRAHFAVHTEAYNWENNNTQKTAKADNVSNPWENWHVYAMEWYADRVDLFLDGKKYLTFGNDNAGDISTWPFGLPQYLLMNVAVGGYGGTPTPSELPQKLYVDYVRYYTKN